MNPELIIIFSFFVLMVSSFYAAQSYILFYWYRTLLGYKKFFKQLKKELKGSYDRKGFYAQSHQVITPLAYKNLPNRDKINFSPCYNIVKFKTVDCRWEIFSYLVKEGFTYGEIVTIRCFPQKQISNEASIEKVRSHISIFSSNRFLSEVLEQKHMISGFEWLIRKDTDSFIIQNNCLVFKMFSDDKLMNNDRIMNCLKVIQNVKKEIFDRDTIRF